MLIANKIPDKEPLLRVGIILPEDSKKSVTIIMPADLSYEVTSDAISEFSEQEMTLDFMLTGESIKYKEYHAPTWTIRPVQNLPIQPHSGLKIKDITAGRGFHWQKPIDIIVSGSIEIKAYENHLILINELPLEEYLMCVATSEMGAACPPALIESQTIAARSWMLANIEQKHILLGMDVCNDDCCQRYQGNANLTHQSIEGAINTNGKVLLYEGKICDARYSKSCGGKMESFTNIWSGPDLPYLRSIPDAETGFDHPALALEDENEVINWIDSVPKTFCSPAYVPESSLKMYLGSVDEEGTYFRWQVSYTQNEITALLNSKLDLNTTGILRFIPLKRGGSGRLTELNIIYLTDNGSEVHYLIKGEYTIRAAMHKGFLYSSCFYVDAFSGDDNFLPKRFTIKGAGWGHGAGYCQIGALGMSLAGYSTEEILVHYYPGSELRKIY